MDGVGIHGWSLRGVIVSWVLIPALGLGGQCFTVWKRGPYVCFGTQPTEIIDNNVLTFIECSL